MSAPSPDADSQAERRLRNLPRGVGSVIRDGLAQAGEGSYLRDSAGRPYIDFAGGIGAQNVGHGHPVVVAAIQRQAATLLHSAQGVLLPRVYLELVERLNQLVPTRAPRKTLLVNSGAEAVENAVKVARRATGRSAVIAFEGGFHGRTLLGMSLTGKATPYRDGFGPFAPEVYHAPYPYLYRGISESDALAALDRVFRTQVEPDRVAAIIVEPVLGEGGFVVPPPTFLSALAERARAHGIVLICDEIQTGFGRTGRMFASQWSNIEPDLILTGKSLAAGLPLAAVTGATEVMDAPEPGGLGGTYGGNPLACAAALAVLEVFEQDRVLEQAAALGERAAAGLRSLAASSRLVGEARGLGAMQALELVQDVATRAPASAETAQVVREAGRRGLLLIGAGLYDNVIRLLMPLTTPVELLDQALSILGEALTATEEARTPRDRH